jgi:hypothetical protein
MIFPQRILRWTALASGLSLAVALSSGVATAERPAIGQSLIGRPAIGPTVKLVVAQKDLTIPQQGKYVIVNPGVYVAAFGSQLQFDVRRASYTKPLTIEQVIHVAGVGTVTRPLPAWVLNGWNGLRRFVRVTIKNSSGKTVASRVVSFCPDSFNAQRADPNAPAGSPFPQECQADPFPLGMVWGIQRGWGVDPIGDGYAFEGLTVKLKRGHYLVTVNIITKWRKLLHVSAADSTAVVHLHVVKPQSGCYIQCFTRHAPKRATPLPNLPAVPVMTNPPKADLPDLAPLPAWDINVANTHSTSNYKASAALDFGATVWVGGNARLDVEGFRVNGSATMAAYQYFWHDGRVVGRERVGTMGFSGYNHWHFKQFAEYRLLNAKRSLVLRSQKEGFCIGASDPIDLLLPHATWEPASTSLSGDCGEPSALWAQETLPVGWGDTYFQYVPGQSFNITSLPNGKYFIQIIANPEHLLHETNTRNDSSLREVILGGTPGHRTVKVPAYFGIDPES